MSFVGKWYGFGRNSFYDAGVRAKERQDWPEAIAQFREAQRVEKDPSFRSVIARSLASALGEAAHHALAHDPSAALALAAEASSLAPKFADLHLVMAKALRAMDRLDEAREAVAEALALNPRYAEALLHAAAIECLADPDMAIVAFQRIRSSGVSVDSAELDEAERRLASGQGGLAAAALDSMRAHEGEEAARRAEEGDKLGRERRWREAAEAYAQAVHEAPGFADLHGRLAQAWLEAGEIEDALKAIDQALAINPSYAEAWAIRGVAMRRMGDEQKAESSFRMALQHDPSQTIAREELLRGPRPD